MDRPLALIRQVNADHAREVCALAEATAVVGELEADLGLPASTVSVLWYPAELWPQLGTSMTAGRPSGEP